MVAVLLVLDVVIMPIVRVVNVLVVIEFVAEVFRYVVRVGYMATASWYGWEGCVVTKAWLAELEELESVAVAVEVEIAVAMLVAVEVAGAVAVEVTVAVTVAVEVAVAGAVAGAVGYGMVVVVVVNVVGI
jgi:hypothetical protein